MAKSDEAIALLCQLMHLRDSQTTAVHSCRRACTCSSLPIQRGNGHKPRTRYLGQKPHL